MDLSTTYLGFELPHPLMPGASPMVDRLDLVRRLEDSGAPMIVMHSLFEEQLIGEQMATSSAFEQGAESYGEAISYLPEPPNFALGPDQYLEQIRRIKQAVAVPVVGSLNGATESGWFNYARLIEQAGADALELNIYELATDLDEPGEAVERRALAVAKAIKQAVSIPVAVKLSPFYSSVASMAKHFDQLGIDALVLFNRFYQPDIDPEQLEVLRLTLSDSNELLLRLRWLALLSGRVRASLGVTGGVHSVNDVVKSVMAGAQGVQLVSALLQHGPEYLRTLRDGLAQWLEEHEYQSLKQMQGSMNLSRCPNPKNYERANYVKLLQSWQWS